jgi:hypothetical protein
MRNLFSLKNKVPAPAATKVPFKEMLNPTGMNERWLMLSRGFMRKLIRAAPPIPKEASGL